MKKIFIAILFFTVLLSSHAEESIESIFLGELEGPRDIYYTYVPLPSPTLLQYFPEKSHCRLIINSTITSKIDPIILKLAIAHEVGHCYALRHNLQKIEDGTTWFGESFADVYSIAWMSKNHPEFLDNISMFLIKHRMKDRTINKSYDTIIAINRAKTLLPSDSDPLEFTLNFFK